VREKCTNNLEKLRLDRPITTRQKTVASFIYSECRMPK
jgi:hypothetical protein